jgi:CAAX prenyl protease-like protein
MPDRSVTESVAGALLVPFLCSVAASMAVDAASADFRVWYPVGVLATAGALWAHRHQYRGLIRRPTWMSICVGVGVFIVWVMIVPKSEVAGDALLGGIAALSPIQAATWITFRIVGCVITVPIAEELAFRGYLLAKLARSSLDSVPETRFTWLSFAVSSLLFGLLHSNWLAGAVAGAGFAMAYYSRGRIIDAIAAHMVSNALIVLAVLAFNRWDLWA